jgi:hypothetical protein
MLKMPHVREHHRDTQLVTRFDGILVVYAAARLYDGADAKACRKSHAVVKREICIGRKHCALDFFARTL